MRNNYYLGVDIGGTVTKIGLVDREANILEKITMSTVFYNSREKLLGQIVKNITEISKKHGDKKKFIKGIGLGIAGFVNYDKGLIYNLVNIKGWKKVEIAKILKAKTGFPVLVDNDVNVITLGEYVFGAAKGAKNVICITLGTGVGGGLIIENKLYRGSSYLAGEIGHFPIKANDSYRCNCGNYGCLERYIGNRNFVSFAIEKIKATGKGAGIMELAEGDFLKITPKVIAKAAEKGDELAGELWAEFALNLGMVLSGLINFLNPDAVVIGGGVAGAGDVLFRPLKEVIKKYSLRITESAVKIRKAQLKDDGGIIGAAALFFQNNS